MVSDFIMCGGLNFQTLLFFVLDISEPTRGSSSRVRRAPESIVQVHLLLTKPLSKYLNEILEKCISASTTVPYLHMHINIDYLFLAETIRDSSLLFSVVQSNAIEMQLAGSSLIILIGMLLKNFINGNKLSLLIFLF